MAQPVESVRLYRSGASITRFVEETPSEGVITIGNLPSSTSPSSIRIQPVELAGGHITHFTFEMEELNEKQHPDLQPLVERVEAIHAELQELKGQQQDLEGHVGHTLRIAESIRKSLEGEALEAAYLLSHRAWNDYAAVRDDAALKIRAIEERRKLLADELVQVERDRTEVQQRLTEKRGKLRVYLADAASASTVQLRVTYKGDAAGWEPIHEIRADPQSGKITWISKASLYQNTGEDWAEAEILLSTAQPASLQPPELQALELFPYGNRYPETTVTGITRMKSAPAASAPALANTTTAFQARIPGRMSLSSGKGPVVREVLRADDTAQFWSTVSPELSQIAWLVAAGVSNLEWPVLEGRAYFFIDDELVSERAIEDLLPGESYELFLGENRSIAVERKERRRKASEGGLIDKTRKVEVMFDTIVANNMKVPHKVVVKDRFPISKENKIQVRRHAPEDVKVEEGTGLFDWIRVLQPGKQDILNTHYTVTFPAEWNINGDF